MPPIGVMITLLSPSLAVDISVTTPPQLNVLFNTSVRFSMNQPVVVLTSEPDHTVVYTWYSISSNGTNNKDNITCEVVLPLYPLAALNATLMVYVVIIGTKWLILFICIVDSLVTLICMVLYHRLYFLFFCAFQVCSSGVGLLNESLTTADVISMTLSIPDGLLRGGTSYRVSILAGGGVISSVARPLSLLWKDAVFNFSIDLGTQKHTHQCYFVIYCAI